MADRPTILLDMDEVCVQFVRPALQLQGLDATKIIDTWPKGVWEIADVCGVAPKVFWGKIEAASPNFWIMLPEYSYFEQMFARLLELGEVFFVTSPAWSAEAAQEVVQGDFSPAAREVAALAA